MLTITPSPHAPIPPAGTVRSRSKDAGGGQALIETAIATPVLLILLFGTLSVGIFLSDRVVSVNAARQGARLGALIGGPLSGLSQNAADQAIVKNVLTVTSGLNFATVQEIDIYAANCSPASSDTCQSTGMYTPGDPIDQWGPNGSPLPAGSQTFTMAMRNQVVPTETSIGVRILYRYSAPLVYQGLGQSIAIIDYAVMKAAPVSF